MAIVFEFPRTKVPRAVHIRKADEPANVIILPVVRIERDPEPFRGGRRRPRKQMLEKLRELQLELGRSL